MSVRALLWSKGQGWQGPASLYCEFSFTDFIPLKNILYVGHSYKNL